SQIIHSGHFMVSAPHRDASTRRRYDFDTVDRQTCRTYRFGPRSASHYLAIDASLTRLFECMTLAYSARLVSPKWKNFKGLKLLWRDKIRLNNAIWRAWHIQYVERRDNPVCHFVTPLDGHDALVHLKPQANILEGKYWKRRIEIVIKEYHNWRIYFKKRWKKSTASLLCKPGHGEPGHGTRPAPATWCSQLFGSLDDVALGHSTQQAQPCDQQNESAWTLHLDTMIMDFSDTLFSSLAQHSFAWPNPREIAHASNADVIQPGLIQLQPSLEDYMDTMDSLQVFVSPATPSALHWPIPPSADDVTKAAMESAYPPQFPQSAAFNVPGNNLHHLQSLPSNTQKASLSPFPIYFANRVSQETRKRSFPMLPEIDAVGSLRTPQANLPLPTQVPPASLPLQAPGPQSSLAAQPAPSPADMRPREPPPQPQPQPQPHAFAYAPSATAFARQQPEARKCSVPGSPDGHELPRREFSAATAAAIAVAVGGAQRLVAPVVTLSGPPQQCLAPTAVPPTLLQPLTSPAQLIPKAEPNRPPLPTPPPPTEEQYPDTLIFFLYLLHHHSSGRASPGTPESRSRPQSPLDSSGIVVFKASHTPEPRSGLREALNLDDHTIEDSRRVTHISAEQKRRFNIKIGFDTLYNLVSPLNLQPNSKVSKAATLQKTVEYITKLQQERQQMLDEAQKLRDEIEELNAEINVCQQQLPATGVPITKQRFNQMRQMFDGYVRARTQCNWKFWIFSILMRPLFESYNGMVSTASMEELCRTVMCWLDQHCALPSLRPIVLTALRHLSTSTSILSDPTLVPEQVAQA
uniref:MLX interacting protein like n=1 Tax=Petromyzon marinus TaxID=7757 RepID=S4R6Z3_PETMA